MELASSPSPLVSSLLHLGRGKHLRWRWWTIGVLWMLVQQGLRTNRESVRWFLSAYSMGERSTVATNTTPASAFAPAFPRWGPAGQDEESFSASLLFDYAHHALTTTRNDTKLSQQQHHLPTAVYLVDRNLTIWTNTNPLRKATFRTLSDRMAPSEWLSVRALAMLRRHLSGNESQQQQQWPHLRRLVEDQGGFFFLVYYKDFVGCNYRNYQPPSESMEESTRLSVPVFTFSARLDCHYAFPWPTYESIALALGSTSDWGPVQMANAQKHRSKQPKAVWRGSLTGAHRLEDPSKSTRWRLALLSEARPDLLDARLVGRLPKGRKFKALNLTSVGNISIDHRMPSEKFQRYEAVVDCDGNAWSSRFASLLCSDSVVLKVTPTMVDHFWWHGLEAWKHYVPVERDRMEDDLLSKIEWVLEHPNQTHAIVEASNDWCAKHMTSPALSRDLLSIWNDYARRWDFTGMTSSNEISFMELLQNPLYKMKKVEDLLPKRRKAAAGG